MELSRHQVYKRTLAGTLTSRFSTAKISAGKRGLSFNITKDNIRDLWFNQHGRCALTGVPMGLTGSGWLAMSLDRIDPYKGYEVDNIQLTCWRVNDAKHKMTQHGFEAMCEAVTIVRKS